MSLSDTVGAERLASSYFLTRLEATRRAQQLSASEQFDLARSPLSDDELEDIVDSFRDTPAPRTGWGLADALNEVMTREPKSIPVNDLQALQRNLVAQGYAPPTAQATGSWDPSWYTAFRRWDRDNFERQREGRHWYSAPVESGIRALTNTLPSRVFQGILGAAKGLVVQTPETLERGGLLGGAAVGAAIGTAIAPGAGTLVGGAVGGVGGFLLDLFGDDEGEPEDQSFGANLVDALSPWTEYNQNPKAVFEDLGYVLTAASVATGVGAAAKGVAAGAGALRAAAAESGSLAKAALTRPAVNNQLGVFGTIVRAASKKLVPGTAGALEQSMLKYSPIAFGQRLGPNIALKAFGGLSQAQMGARLFGGMGAGSKQRFEEAKAALEAELGRSLKEDEVRQIERQTAGTAIEQAIASAPELKTGVELPFLGDLVDVAAFVLYPERLLPFSGAQIGRSAVNIMGDTTLAPYAHALMDQNPSLSIRKAVSQVKGWLKPTDNAWLRADYGINREAHSILNAAKLSPEKAYKTNALANARADVIRTIRKEYDAVGKSETLERVMRYSMDTVERLDGPTDFTAWLVGLNGKHRGLDRLAAWKEANTLARRLERDMNEGRVAISKKLLDEDIATELAGSRLGRGQDSARRMTVGAAPGPTTIRPESNVDLIAMRDRIRYNEKLAARFERIAERGATDPYTSIAARERARLARAEAETLKKNLRALEAKSAVPRTAETERFTITPAREEFADRQTILAKRDEFIALRQDVLAQVDKGNLGGEAIARQKLANFVDQLAADGFVPDELARKAKVGKPTDRIAKVLEIQSRSAAATLEGIPEDTMARFAELGYKPVATGDDVIFPDQLEQMVEVAGIGDYTRRAQVWETLGLSPKWRTDRALFRLRREHELSELEQVFAENGVKLSGEQALRRLHERLRDINHDGAVLGPFRKSKEGPLGLYKVDTRDLSPQDIFAAFEDIPGVTDDVAHQIFGALRRGAAYGGELKLLHPVTSAKALGSAMRLNGLPGFSDLVRTWHAQAPDVMSRGALRREAFRYKPAASADSALDLAHSAERARVETALKDVSARTQVSEGQRQFGMMMLDSMARTQVGAGRFDSVDAFYKHLDVGFAERYVEQGGDQLNRLFRRVMDLPRTKGETIAVTPKGAPAVVENEMRRYMAHLARFEDTPSWYENSAEGFNRLFAGAEITLRDGKRYPLADVMSRIVAETSGGLYPTDNLKAAMKAMKTFIEDKSFRHIDIKSGSGYHRYGKSVYKKVDAILDGQFPSTEKYGPFFNAVQGRLDDVVVDRRMAILFGISPETLTDAERVWVKDQVKELAARAGIKPGHAQERLWLAFNDILDESEALARRRGDAETADAIARISRVKDDASADYGTLIRENVPTRKPKNKADVVPGFRDVVEETFGPIGDDGALVQQLFKKAQDEVLAYTQFGDDMVTTLRFFRDADFGTLVHENAHMLRRLLSDEDVQILERAYGVTKGAADKPIFRPASPEDLVALRAKLPADRQHFVTPYTAQQMREEGFRVFMNEEKTVGYVLKPDGEIANVVNIGGPRGAGREAVVHGILQGGDRVEYFDGKLGEIYGSLGFKETERFPFDLEMMHQDFPGYDPAKLGEPSYVVAKLSSSARKRLLKGLESRVPSAGAWPREAEEKFALDAEKFFLRRVKPSSAPNTFSILHGAVANLWGSTRPYWSETGAVPREVRKLFDREFADVLSGLPKSRGKAALGAAGSKQVLGGAVAGGVLGATEGDDSGDILRGVALGAVAGLGARSAVKRTYGYLPDYLARANTALRYTLSLTFDAGRYTEQNMIAMAKHGLPPMLAPTKYIKAREWRSPFSAGKVSGEQAWKDAVHLWDELNGTTFFQNIDDIDRRMFQAGMLGFSPRNWEVAQAFQLYQRGMSNEKIVEAISQIGRYGVGRTAAEKSANFVVFPFSFSKKLLSTLGDFFLQAPARSLILHEGFRRYHESEFDDKVSDFLDRRLPILKQLAQINNLAYGISPGRFFLQGLSDRRTGVGQAAQLLASAFIPSGAATALQQAFGAAGDMAVNAFTPIVLTGESITRAGGMPSVAEIMRTYIPFVRELDQYFLSENNALRQQIVALSQGAEPYYQLQKYQDELKLANAEWEPLATAMGYSGVDGLRQSSMGMMIDAELEQKKFELQQKYPTGFELSTSFENTDAIDQKALQDLAERVATGRASDAEERILQLYEDEQRFEQMKTVAGLPAEIVNAMAASTIRKTALQYVDDRRFGELYQRFFERTYGPIRRVA